MNSNQNTRTNRDQEQISGPNSQVSGPSFRPASQAGAGQTDAGNREQAYIAPGPVKQTGDKLDTEEDSGPTAQPRDDQGKGDMPAEPAAPGRDFLPIERSPRQENL